MKKVLIGGGSHSELPLIESAKSMGLYVVTTGTNTEGLGHREADKYVPGDFSDREFMLKLAEDEQVDFVISGCNDFSYLSTAYVCEKLGLSGHDNFETAQTVHSKDKFRQLTRSLGIPTPRTAECFDMGQVEEAVRELRFPLVVKPVDLTGGKGVMICGDEGEAVTSAKKAFAVSRADRILIEEFVDGKSYGTSVMLKDHRVICSVFGNEQYYMNKYLVAGACTGADLAERTKKLLCADIEKISRSLGLCDGLFHTQFVVDEKGIPVIIDPCRRAPGDLYVKFARLVTGVDFPGMIVSAETGGELFAPEASADRYIARMCIMTDGNGIYKSVSIPEGVRKNIVDSLIWAKPGERIEDFMKYKAGILFIEEESPKALYEMCGSFYENVRIITE